MPKQRDVGGELEQLRDELAEMETLAKRVQADFQNYRRRAEEERGEALARAKEAVISGLLPVLDNIDRVLNHAPEGLEETSWAQGIRRAGKQAEETLTNLGITKIDAPGVPIDPKRHKVVAAKEYNSPVSLEEMTHVSAILQPGYALEDRVIRPAAVIAGKEGGKDG